VDWPLEVNRAPGVYYQAATGYGVPVDRDIRDAAERTVVSKPEDVHLSRPSEYVASLELLSGSTTGADDLDAEITNSHAAASKSGSTLV
jgi:hypothetical protein